MKTQKLTLVSATLLFLASAFLGANARAASFESGVRQVSLVELFSSEGCSSCPPADDWLSGLREKHGLWKEFVPVAFHVDYWDYIGWKDRFGSPVATHRQRDYAKKWSQRTLYTPCVVLNGEELRGWYQGNSLPRGKRKPGVLKTVQKENYVFEVSFTPEPEVKNVSTLTVHAALLGMGLVSDVKMGENRGRRLTHNFVVLDYSRKKVDEKNGVFTAILTLKPPKETTVPQKFAGAFWVSADEPQPLQATGGTLD